MRYATFLLPFLLSCSPPDQHPRELSRVSASGLVNYYRDNPRGTAYTGAAIQVRLDPGAYRAADREVYCHTGVPHTPPVIVFRCLDPVNADPKKHWIILTGTCTGPVRDGIRKGDRINFTIYVEHCHVTRVEVAEDK